MILPGGPNSFSGANLCQMSVKDCGQEVEIISESESFDIDDDEDSHVSRKEVHCNPSNIDGNKSVIDEGAAEVDARSRLFTAAQKHAEVRYVMEAVRQRNRQNPYPGEWVLPQGSNSSSGATSCKIGVKTGGLDDNEDDELVSRSAGWSSRGVRKKLEKKLEEKTTSSTHPNYQR